MVARPPLGWRRLLLGTALGWPLPALAAATLPQDGQFVAGVGRLARSPGGLTITQRSARGIINWHDFSIGVGRTVTFQNGAGATLNRVTGNAPSTIAGTLGATGSVYLVNPQGIVIGPGGTVRTGGSFVASTRPADAAAFMAGGGTALHGASASGVENLGTLVAGGDVVLVGRTVTNGGGIQAGGSAALLAADRVALQVTGDTSVVLPAAGDVRNTGAIEVGAQVALQAAGGNVYALAGAGGYVKATGMATRNGRVLLVAGGDVAETGRIAAEGGAIALQAGGTARVSGTLDAHALTGGTITVTGHAVSLAASARLDASGAAQGGRILVGGDRGGGRDVARKLVAAPVATAATTTVANGATLLANGGSGGSVVVWSDAATDFAGGIAAAGGFAEVSSHGVLRFAGRADLRAAGGRRGTLLLDPADVYITTGSTPTGASAISPTTIAQQLAVGDLVVTTSGGAGNGDIFVQSPVSWSGAGTLTLSATRNIQVAVPIAASGIGSVVLAADAGGTGVGSVSFIGSGAVQLAGGTATILSNPASYAAPTDYSGSVSGGALTALMLVTSPAQLQGMTVNAAGSYALGRDIDLSATDGFAGVSQFNGLFDGRGHAITGMTISQPGSGSVGLFGSLGPGGVVRNLAVTGAQVSGGNFVGVLVGWNDGLVSGVTTTGTVTASSDYAGGMIGVNVIGTIAESSSAAAVRAPYYVGGLAGWNSGVIRNTFATGAVSGGGAGGLVGINATYAQAGTIDASYSTGAVSGASAGGLVALLESGAVTHSYWDTQSSGQASSAGGTGLTTAALQAGLPAGFATTAWSSVPGQYPTLLNTPAAAAPVLLGGTLFAGRATSPIGGGSLDVLVDGTLYGPVTAASDGAWSLSLARSAVASTGSDVLAALLGGTQGNTVVAGVEGSTTGIDIYAGTLRLVVGPGGTATLSSLFAARAQAVGTLSLAALMAPGAAAGALGATNVDLVSPSGLALDQTLSTSGTVVISAGGGAITQTAPLAAGALALQAGAATVTLTNSANTIGILAGAVGAADIATSGALRIDGAAGAWGLAGNATLQVTAGGTLTVAAPVSAAGTGDALVLAAPGLVETAGTAALSVSGGGRWLAYLPDPGAVSLSGLSALPYYGRSFDLSTRAGATVAGAGNRFVYAVSPTLEVTPVSASVTYDGSVPSVGVAITGLLAGDTLASAVSGTPTVTGAVASAGTWTLTAGIGSLASDLNYQFASQTGTLAIAAKPLGWSVADAAATYGTLAAPGSVTLTGVIGGDAVAGLVRISRAGAVVTLSPTTPAGGYAEALSGLSGAAADNYVLGAGTSGTLAIAAKPLGWSVADAAATYGTLATPGSVTLTGVVGGDAVAGLVRISRAGAVVALSPTTPAGGYAEALSGLSGAAADNYVLGAGTSGTLAIAPKPLGWSVADAAATYGTLAAPGAVTLTGVVGGDAVAGLVRISRAGAVVALSPTTPAGGYAEALSGLSGAAADNYVLGAGTSGTLAIAAKPLGWSVADAAATYGTLATPGSVTLTGVVGGDAVAGLVRISRAGAVVALSPTTPAGGYAEALSGLSGAAADNYVLGAGTSGTLAIAAKPLGWSVADAAATYGTLAAPGSVTLTGVVGGDAVAGLVRISRAGAVVALSPTTPAGGYAEALSGLSGAAADNYVLGAGTSGTLAIAAKPLGWSVADAAATYGTLAAPGSVTLTGVVGGDAVAGLVQISRAGAVVTLSPTTPAGGYAETLAGLGGASAGNYVLGAGTSGTLAIAAKPLGWSVADAAATYGTLAAPGAVTLTGVVGGDAVAGLVRISRAGAVVALSPTTPAGGYAEALSGLSGAAADNYVLGAGTSGTLAIAAKPLGWSIADAAATYGTLATPGSVTLTGVVGGDAVAGLVQISRAGAVVTLSPTTPAGGYAETLAGLGGASAGNYVLGAGTSGTLAIAPKPLGWSVADAAATYGTLAAPGSVTLTGVVGGDAVAGLVQISRAGAVVTLSPTTPAGGYAEALAGLSGAAADNYVLGAGTSGTLAIAAKPLGWSVADAAATYGTLATPGSVTLTGVVGGDAVAGLVQISRAGAVVTLSPTTPAGGYAETLAGLSGAAADNYRLLPEPAGTLHILPGLIARLLAPSVAGTAATHAASTSPAERPDAAATVTSAAETTETAASADAPSHAAADSGRGAAEGSAAHEAAGSHEAPAGTPRGAAIRAALAPHGAPTGRAAPVRLASLPRGDAKHASSGGSRSEARATRGAGTTPATPATGEARASAGGHAAAALASARDAGAAKAVEAGVASHGEARAMFDARANQVIARGGSPEQAAAAARQALVQLVAASVRTGPATEAQHLGDGLAAGQAVAGGPALAAALARGGAVETALRDATQRAQAEQAQAAEAAVPAAAETQATQALAQAAADDPAATAQAAAIATGKDATQAVAAAHIAAATRAAMTRAATVPVQRAERAAAALAGGGAGISPALAAALARGLSGAVALAEAARAEAAAEAASRRADGGSGDALATALAGATASSGDIVVRAGTPTRATDTAAAQLARAEVPLPADDPAAGLAGSIVPPALADAPPGVAARLAAGLPPDEVVRAAAAARLAAAQQSAAAVVPPDDLAALLANGPIAASDLERLADGRDPAAFASGFLARLAHGAAPATALAEARSAIQVAAAPQSAEPAVAAAAPERDRSPP